MFKINILWINILQIFIYLNSHCRLISVNAASCFPKLAALQRRFDLRLLQYQHWNIKSKRKIIYNRRTHDSFNYSGDRWRRSISFICRDLSRNSYSKITPVHNMMWFLIIIFPTINYTWRIVSQQKSFELHFLESRSLGQATVWYKYVNCYIQKNW